MPHRPSPESTEDVFVDLPAVGPMEVKQAAQSLLAQRDIAILADLESGKTYREAAATHDVSVTTIYRLTQRVKTYEEAARKYFAMRAFAAVDDWATASQEAAKKGDHRPAKDLLLHSKVIDPVQDVSKVSGPAISITIGDGRSSLGIPDNLPVIDVPVKVEE